MNNTRMLLALLFVGMVSFGVHAGNIQFVTGAPTGAPNEPVYSNGAASIDWLPVPIAGDYYVASLGPIVDSFMRAQELKTIGVYRFIPGNPPTLGSLEFIASAPTDQCISGVCDEQFNGVQNLSWFGHALDGAYYLTVVGMEAEGLVKLGIPGQQTIRVYRFNPDTNTPANGTIDFIDSAPLQVSEGEPRFMDVIAVDWFDGTIAGGYYFAAVGGSSVVGRPQVRVYSFDPTAPLGTNLSFVGAAANGTTDPQFDPDANSVSWLPELVDGNSYFAVGGDENDSSAIRVYRFCPELCFGTDPSPENRIQLIATAPTNAVLDFSVGSATAVRWLVVNGRYYLAATVSEQALSPFRKPRLVRIYEFIPGASDPTLGSLRFVTSAPVDAMCCDSDLNDAINRAETLDWLTKDGNYYLLVGGRYGENTCAVLIYQFDVSSEKLIFVSNKEFDTPGDLMVDWFPGSIEGNCYFGVSIAAGISFLHKGNTTLPVEIFTFRPPCNFTSLSCKSPL